MKTNLGRTSTGSQASLPLGRGNNRMTGRYLTSSPIASRRKIRWHVDEQCSSKSASSSRWPAKAFGTFCLGLPSTNSPKLKALLLSITILLTRSPMRNHLLLPVAALRIKRQLLDCLQVTDPYSLFDLLDLIALHAFQSIPCSDQQGNISMN